ncbi:MAG: hypothetical protein AAGA95_15090, partial [Pseudomonadota bacterium]
DDATKPLTHWGTQNGTSAVAPLWAALVAQLNQAHGSRLGHLNPWLYGQSGGLTDVAKGDNVNPKAPDREAWKATGGWDPCTGLGVPDGSKLLDLVRKQLPLTPSRHPSGVREKEQS